MDKFKPWRYPARWAVFRINDPLLLIIITGAFVGICSGLAALLLSRSLIAILDFLHNFRQLWWTFILPAVGASFSALFLEQIVHEGAGHGVPEVIYSVSRYGGLLRFRSSFSRLISSIFAIAGMVFSMEVILGEWTAIHIIPIAIAAVAGTEVSRILQENQIAFSHRQFIIGPLDMAFDIMGQ